MRFTNPRNPILDETCGSQRRAPTYRERDSNDIDPPLALIENNFVVVGGGGGASVPRRNPNEGRLIAQLRAAAQLRKTDPQIGDPVEILVRSAVAFFPAFASLNPLLASNPVAQALADLAVTGRAAYEEFRRIRPLESHLLNQVRQEVSRLGLSNVTDQNIQNCIGQVLDRAYKVARFLRGETPRNDLGWIAVSGEDDQPHRPVNVSRAIDISGIPGTEYTQHDIQVTTQGKNVQTRYLIASAPRPPLPLAPIDLRRLPIEKPPQIPPQDEIILFIHGHSSRAEECTDLVKLLGGTRYTIIAMDLPCCGYSSMFDHNSISNTDDTGPIALEQFPILEFIEQFIVDFVSTFEAQTGINLKSRIAAVIGGSLGGNLGLRLAQRDPVAFPWLNTIVSWSPASVWRPFAGDPLKDLACKTPRKLMNQPEETNTRHDFFNQAFDDDHTEDKIIAQLIGSIIPIVGNIVAYELTKHVLAQPQLWYSDGWSPCKQIHIDTARRERREIYNESFRRWHWRLALQQLLFSHRYRDRYKSIHSRVLLASGEKDDFNFSNIYTATRELALLMLNTRGHSLFLKETGHSIHNEHPQELAQAIRQFLPPQRPDVSTIETWGRWQSMNSGALSSTNTSLAVGTNEDGRLEVFAINQSNRVWHIWQSEVNRTSWSNGTELANGENQKQFVGQVAIGQNTDGRLQVHARTRDNLVYRTVQKQPNGAWDNWEVFKGTIGGAIRPIAGDPCVEIRIGGPGIERFQLVGVRLSDGRVCILGQKKVAGPWWGDVKPLGNRRFIGSPAIARNQDGRLEMFARDAGGNVFHIWETASDAWIAEWVNLNNGVVTGDLAVARNVDGRLEVFGRGQNGELWHTSQLSPNAPNGAWSGWSSLGGSLQIDAKPAVALNAWGGLQVFVRWSDDSIRYLRQKPEEGFVWTSWQSLGGVVRSNPAVGVNVNGSLVVFALQTDFALYFSEQRTTKLIAQNWIVNGNTWWGVLNIPSVVSDGTFNGTIYGNPLSGRWSGSSRQISFVRTVSPPDYLQNWVGTLSYSLEGAFTEQTNGVTSPGFYAWQAWQSIKVAFRTSTGQFLSVQPGVERKLVANGSSVDELAKLELIALGNNKIALKSANGQYVCAEAGGGRELVANRSEIGPWEMFELVGLGNGNMALKASNGQYVCAENGGGEVVNANRNAVGPWETFNLTISS